MTDTRRLLIGTTKGTFILEGAPDGTAWMAKGPLCQGWPINHAACDPDSGTLWAAGGSDFFGAGVWRSTDGGETWSLTRLTKGSLDDWAESEPDFAKSLGWTPEPPPLNTRFTQIWSLGFAHGRLWAGAKPATLLVSDDLGQTWEAVESLTDHPSAKDWNPGAAGLTLHTLVFNPVDSQKMWAGISAAGVFATEDGGATWERRNRLSNAEACGNHDHPAAPSNGETGHCVHNMMRASGPDDLLYQQNHHGVWRSADGGRSWDDITPGLPSTFGFPIRVHPHDPKTLWTIPLNGDSAGRFPPDAACAVWRSCDGGDNWQDMRVGLPQTGCFFTVLRQAMAGDTEQSPGVYFGTNSGSIFASFDEGDTWHEIARHLPLILGLEAI